MSDLEAMPLGSITISYNLGDDGHPNVGISAEGDLDMVTLLGMLRMAENTVLDPEWNEHDE